jgi:hypothetical protein
VIAEVARVLMDGDFPVVIRPEFEPPWRSTDAIDTLYAIKEGEPLSGIAASPEIMQGQSLLDRAAKQHKKAAGQKLAEHQLQSYDIDPFDADAAQSSWDAPQLVGWAEERSPTTT